MTALPRLDPATVRAALDDIAEYIDRLNRALPRRPARSSPDAPRGEGGMWMKAA